MRTWCNLYNERTEWDNRGRTAAKLKRRNDQNGTTSVTSGGTCRRNTMILRAGWWLNQHSQVVLLHEISQFNTLRIPIQGKPIMTNHPARYMHKNFYASILSYSQLLNWVVLPSRLQKTCQTTMSNHIKVFGWCSTPFFNQYFENRKPMPLRSHPHYATPLPPFGSTSQPGGHQNSPIYKVVSPSYKLVSPLTIDIKGYITYKP